MENSNETISTISVDVSNLTIAKFANLLEFTTDLPIGAVIEIRFYCSNSKCFYRPEDISELINTISKEFDVFIKVYGTVTSEFLELLLFIRGAKITFQENSSFFLEYSKIFRILLILGERMAFPFFRYLQLCTDRQYIKFSEIKQFLINE